MLLEHPYVLHSVADKKEHGVNDKLEYGKEPLCLYKRSKKSYDNRRQHELADGK